MCAKINQTRGAVFFNIKVRGHVHPRQKIKADSAAVLLLTHLSTCCCLPQHYRPPRSPFVAPCNNSVPPYEPPPLLPCHITDPLDQPLLPHATTVYPPLRASSPPPLTRLSRGVIIARGTAPQSSDWRRRGLCSPRQHVQF